MTLYLTPAWMTSGLMRVADQRPERPARTSASQRAREGGLAAARVVVADRPSERGRHRAAARAASSSRKRRMTGVTRGSPGAARRRIDLGGHDGGVVVARHRAVAPRAADVDPVDLEALLGDLDRVEAPAGQLHRDAAGLVEGTGRARASRGGSRRASCAPSPAAGLLVGGAGEEDVAAQAGDRVRAGSRPAARASAREQDARPRSPSRPSPSCRRRRDPRRSRRRRRPRTGRASTPSGPPGRRRGARAGAAGRRRSRRRGGGR